MMCVFSAMLANLTSCTKHEMSDRSDLIPSKNLSAVSGLVSTADAKFNLLGYGYNLLGEYSNARSATYKVIDVDRLDAEQTGRVEIIPTQGQDSRLQNGINAEDYAKGISGSLEVTRGFKLFPLTIKAAFRDSSSLSTKYVYSSYSILVKQRTYKFAAGAELLRNYVTPAFTMDVQNATPAELISRYGTHILSDILLGAKLDLMYQAQTRNEDRIKAASGGINAGVKGVFTIDVKGAENSTYASRNFSQMLHYRTVGGDPTRALIGDIYLGNDPNQTVPKINVSSWQESATLANSELIEINEKGLIPIYELIADPAKRAAVAAYVNQYMIDNQIKSSTDPVTVFYNGRSDDHVYTIDKTDYPYAQNGWVDLGTNFHAFASQIPGTQPVHVFYHGGSGDHVYTINRYDYPYESNGWTYLGVNFYAFTTQVAGTAPVHVFYTERGGDHVYTINRNDYPYEQRGYRYLGINFYAYKNATSR